MDALVSGQGSGALLIGHNVLAWLEPNGNRIDIAPSELQLFLHDGGTFFPLEHVKEDRVLDAIGTARKTTEAVTCVAMLLNPRISERARNAAAEELAVHLESHEVKTELEALLWSGEVAPQADFAIARQMAGKSGGTGAAELLQRLERDQPLIRTVRSAWDSISDDDFQGKLARDDVFYFAVRDGWFMEAVRQLRKTPKEVARVAEALEKKTTHLESDVAHSAIKVWRSALVKVIGPSPSVSGSSEATPRRPLQQVQGRAFQFALLGKAFVPRPPGILSRRRKARLGRSGPARQVEKRQLFLRQTKSGIGCQEYMRESLRALGLGKPHKTSVRADNPVTRGLIAKVSHLIEVGEYSG
jgi:large subunit ribosomal protein L30